MIPGTLSLRPKSADIQMGVDRSGKMSPFVQFTVGRQVVQSMSAINQGNKPTWQDTLVINITSELYASIKLLDKSSMGTDELIGEAKMVFADICQKKQGTTQIALVKKGYNTATLVLEYSFVPDGSPSKGNRQTQQQAAQQLSPTQKQQMKQQQAGFNQYAMQTARSPSRANQQVNITPPSTLKPVQTTLAQSVMLQGGIEMENKKRAQQAGNQQAQVMAARQQAQIAAAQQQAMMIGGMPNMQMQNQMMMVQQPGHAYGGYPHVQVVPQVMLMQQGPQAQFVGGAVLQQPNLPNLPHRRTPAFMRYS